MRGRAWTDKDDRALAAAWRGGVPVEGIAWTLGRTVEAVRARVKNLGLESRNAAGAARRENNRQAKKAEAAKRKKPKVPRADCDWLSAFMDECGVVSPAAAAECREEAAGGMCAFRSRCRERRSCPMGEQMGECAGVNAAFFGRTK